MSWATARGGSRAAAVAPLLLLLLSSSGGASSSSSSSSSSVFKYGADPGAQLAHAGTAWTYDMAGDDWRGADEGGAPWACLTGRAQSPINLLTSSPVASALAAAHRADWAALPALPSNGSSISVANNGHTVVVAWPDAGGGAGFTLPVQPGASLLSHVELQTGDRVATVTALPQQLHFHTHSEHLLAGRLFPLEAHLVSVVPQASLPACPPDGCVVVTAVLFELADDVTTPNAWLAPVFDTMPLSEGASAFLRAGASLDLSGLLPPNRTYLAYSGSLTTPPCTEGVLWLVLLTPQKLGLGQWRRFMQAVGDYNCSLDASGLGSAAGYDSSGSGSANATSSSAGASGSNATAGTNRLQRRRLQQAQAQHFACTKLGAGANFRMPQPLNGRVLRYWRDSKKSYLPEDAASAASAGAVAGIVLGVTLGAGLTALGGWLVYRAYQKRRLKRFYRYGVSPNELREVQREVESQWLATGDRGGGGALPMRPL